MEPYAIKNTTLTDLLLKELRVMQLTKGLDSDEAFQANSIFKDNDGSHGRWEALLREDYFHSMVVGLAPTPFILVDLKKCYAAADKAERHTDIAYFKKWIDKGVTHLIVDAYNRNETIELIYNDKVKLPPNTYKLSNGETCVVSEGHNVWSKLPQPMREHCETESISLAL